MNSLNGHLIFFGILMILVFVVDYFFINLKKYNQIVNKGKKKVTNKKKKEVSSEIGELNYLVAKFKLDKKKINYKSAILWISFINAFIISFVSTVISAIPGHIIWQLLVGFVLIFILIYSLYEIYGRILVKKGWGKDE